MSVPRCRTTALSNLCTVMPNDGYYAVEPEASSESLDELTVFFFILLFLVIIASGFAFLLLLANVIVGLALVFDAFAATTAVAAASQ